MEFLSLSRRRSSARNVPSGEERGETDVFAGYLFYFQLFFLTDPRSPILDPRSSILDPDFPVTLEVMLMKIVLFFDH